MTQAELAEKLGVTNKAVSKWETGEAMPETALLLPISRIFDVSVDELLEGKRKESCNRNECKTKMPLPNSIKNHLFTKKDEENKTLSDIIKGAICSVLIFMGITTYLILGAVANLWHPYWVIIPCCAFGCGIVGIVCDLLSKQKRQQKKRKGENPFLGGICGLMMMACLITYLLANVFLQLWHPLWVIIIAGVFFCVVTSAISAIVQHRKPKD